jgi:hypothetical protein
MTTDDVRKSHTNKVFEFPVFLNHISKLTMRSVVSLCALVATAHAVSSPFGSAAYSKHFGRVGTDASYDCMFIYHGL